MKGKKKFAVAVTAMSLATVVGGVGAAGAQAQTEVLSGTPTTTSGSWWCYGIGRVQQRSGTVRFTGEGTATGAYPGSLSESGAASVYVPGTAFGPIGWGYFDMVFAIRTPDGTTISGSINDNRILGVAGCGWIGFGAGGPTPTYTATVRAPRDAPQSISGTAAVRATLPTTVGSQDSLSVTLTLP